MAMAKEGFASPQRNGRDKVVRHVGWVNHGRRDQGLAGGFGSSGNKSEAPWSASCLGAVRAILLMREKVWPVGHGRAASLQRWAIQSRAGLYCSYGPAL
jgi:hypothetical protein